jgi:hypothetical protein
MAFDIKFGYATGYDLVFTVFEPNGAQRGTSHQPLYEIPPTGYYRAESAEQLQDGDVVLVYNNEILYWEEDPLTYLLTYGYMLYDGEQLYWEGEPLYDYDETVTENLTWVGDTVGSGEYTIGAGDYTTIYNNTELMIDELQRVHSVYDETEPAKEVVVIKNL